MSEINSQDAALKKSCTNCGAELTYTPGTRSINCNYCGNIEEVVVTENGFEELELYPYLKHMGAQKHSEEITILHCKNCGANQHVEENYKSLHCVYCSTPLILEDAHNEEWILPGAILPFQISNKKAHQIFKQWVNSLWFAPSTIKKASLDPQFTKGLYLPFWTFDAKSITQFTGERGDYYYENQRYRDSKGKTRTRQVRKTRWTSASGTVTGFIDDTLIKAFKKPTGRIPNKVAHWNLDKLVSFNTDFLLGFVTEKYTISLKEGHSGAEKEAEYIIEPWCRRKIGGDTQRVTKMDISLFDETFKHILLPVYISSYRFNGKEYHFYVNGQTGVLSGSRPYSFWKIFFLVLFIIVVIALIATFAK